MVERYSSHARSFSSEKIMQDFQTLQRLGASMAGGPAAGGGTGTALEGGQPYQQHMLASSRDRRSISEPRGASAKVTDC